MKYEIKKELKDRALDIIFHLNLNHIKTEKIVCLLSEGSKSRAIARCHGLSKVMQLSLNVSATYALEFIKERFEKLNEEEQTKIIIHELLHIPKNFGGGFRHHDFVNNKKVDLFYREYLFAKRKKENEKNNLF